jgi:prephenate dehydrogenase
MSNSIKLALLGLDRITASIGLALKERKDILTIGFDKSPEQARLAQARGLVQQAKWNLLEAVDGADVVLMGGLVAEQPEWLEALGGSLRQDAVVATLGPLLAPPLTWAAKSLPAGRHFVAAHPILNPAQLFEGTTGLESASKDLFTRGLWAVAAPQASAPEAVKLLGDVAHLLGAQAFYMDAAEHDGLMAAVNGVPALLAASLLRAANHSAGWHEARKVADRGFATSTFAVEQAEAAALILNRENVLRYLDVAQAELNTLREALSKGDRLTLGQLLVEAETQRAQWLAARQKGAWEKEGQNPLEVPTFGEAMGRMLTGGLFQRKREGGR